jgi:hypothetical protein
MHLLLMLYDHLHDRRAYALIRLETCCGYSLRFALC